MSYSFWQRSALLDECYRLEREVLEAAECNERLSTALVRTTKIRDSLRTQCAELSEQAETLRKELAACKAQNTHLHDLECYTRMRGATSLVHRAAITCQTQINDLRHAVQMFDERLRGVSGRDAIHRANLTRRVYQLEEGTKKGTKR